ncbi:hypothetical protein HMPREF0765_1696 [Sphingobacterium spiritivorum ATCC 33300]|uniref:Uncharacterized protein n=2 Tax=Sphingobacterium spiritivorum TaxID=258 RepID=C2FWJ0_SPHSI|nr:hypothetical protein HMPREF0765_1696 [Sphingobacterium spiritivorum ATCC 33300]QQS94200.1 hypothetical protein I6J03_12340 [Sphingobacterium spiritivorum]
MHMIFESKQIVYSLEDNWDELVSITFVNAENYLSLSSLAYEDEIGIEINDQTNCISALKSDFKYEFAETSIHFTIENPIIQNNVPDLKFVVNFSTKNADKLKSAVIALVGK